MASQDTRLSMFKADFKQQQSEMTNKIDTMLKAITDRITGTLPSNTVKNPKLNTALVLSTLNKPDVEQEEEGSLGNTNSNLQPDPLASIATKQVQKLNLMLESLGLVPQSSNTKFVCSKEDDGEVMFIEIIRDDDEPRRVPIKAKGQRRENRLYLMRKSLEIIRKFHWMILGGRFNQLSYVSSPLLSKPWEY
ncbi:hypothetical protein Tco_1325883 [Tanacetum coccineum]